MLKHLHCGYCSCFSHDPFLKLEVVSRERSLRVIRPWALLRRLARSSSREPLQCANLSGFRSFSLPVTAAVLSFVPLVVGENVCRRSRWRDRAYHTPLKTKCSQDSKATMRNTTPDDKDGKRRQSPNSNRSKWSHMITHFLSSIMVFHHVSFRCEGLISLQFHCLPAPVEMKFPNAARSSTKG